MAHFRLYSRHRFLLPSVTAFLVILYLLCTQNRPSNVAISSTGPPGKRYAYCTYLAASSPKPKTAHFIIADEDHYYQGVRMLAYRLLHDPKTRTNHSIPFIVLAAHNVPRSQKDRLIADGATVIDVSPIVFNWIKPGRERWKHVLDKLHVFELVQFDKILLLDSDVVVIKPLDDVFEDSSTNKQNNLGIAESIAQDEAVQLSSYIMAANKDTDHEHGLNAGFIVLQPSITMYKHYLSIAAIEGRFNGSWPEQDLWNYVHRPGGNMPWKQIPSKWSANTPWYKDYEKGVASMHEKYWGCGRDRKLRDVLLRNRFEMEGFFHGRDYNLEHQNILFEQN